MSFEGKKRPVSEWIPLCDPEIRGNELMYLQECLKTNYVSSVGPFVDRFEGMMAKQVCAKFAVATVNGTSALHMALLVAGVKPDDEVLVSTLTFIAPVNAIRYVGAWPVFVDAEPDYWQMDARKLVDFVERDCIWRSGALYNQRTGRRVSAIIPVHILGHPVDMDPIIEIAEKYNLKVIEDATEGLGAKYKGRPLGSLGDIACFSFNGNKIITTGGGGMIVTDHEGWARKAKYLTTQAKDDPVEYIHNEIGYNYRLTNLQAAVGCAQLEKLDDYVEAKRNIADTYRRTLAGVPGISLMQEASWAHSTYWMYTVLVDELQYGMGSRALLQKLGRCKIQSRPLWQPIHLSPAHSGSASIGGAAAEQLYKRALSIPCSVGLSREAQNHVACQISVNRKQ